MPRTVRRKRYAYVYENRSQITRKIIYYILFRYVHTVSLMLDVCTYMTYSNTHTHINVDTQTHRHRHTHTQ